MKKSLHYNTKTFLLIYKELNANLIKDFLNAIQIFCIFNIFCEKLYSWGISQNINKAIPVTDWPSEWQTENTSNVNIFNIEIFLLSKVSSRTFILDDIRKTKKMSEWLRDQHVQRGSYPKEDPKNPGRKVGAMSGLGEK